MNGLMPELPKNGLDDLFGMAAPTINGENENIEEIPISLIDTLKPCGVPEL